MPREIGDTLRPWRGERSWLSTESLCPPHPHLRALSHGPSCSFWDCPSPHQVAAVGDPREGPTGPPPVCAASGLGCSWLTGRST